MFLARLIRRLFRLSVVTCLSALFVAVISAASAESLPSSADVQPEKLRNTSYCGSYCNTSGQLVPVRRCGRGLACCGSWRSRTCCAFGSLAHLSSSPDLWRDVTACVGVDWVDPDDEIDEWPEESEHTTSTTTLPPTTTATWSYSTLQWWWFVVPIMTMTCLMFALGICYAVRYQEFCCRSRSTSDQLRRVSVHTETESRPRSSDDDFFDPSNVCAFSPPPYDSLPKDPPTYAEICPSNDESFWINETPELAPPVEPRRTSESRDRLPLPPLPTTTEVVTSESPYIDIIY